MPTPTSINFYSVTNCYETTNSIDGERHGSPAASGGKPFGATLREARQTADGPNIAYYGGNKLPNSNLQQVTLGPQVNIIMPAGPPPDDQSLLAFARSQGIDERLIQQLLDKVIAGDGGDAELEIQPAALSGDVPQVFASAAVFLQPSGVAMPLAGVATVQPEQQILEHVVAGDGGDAELAVQPAELSGNDPLVGAAVAFLVQPSGVDMPLAGGVTLQPDAEQAAGTRFEAGRAGGAVMPDVIAKLPSAIRDALAAASTVVTAAADGSGPVTVAATRGAGTAPPSEFLLPASSAISRAIAPQSPPLPSPATANHVAAPAMVSAAMAAGTAGLSVAQILPPALAAAQLAWPSGQAAANVNPAGGDPMALPLNGYATLTPAQPGSEALRADGALLRALVEGPSIPAQVAAQVAAQVPAGLIEARAVAIATGPGVAKLGLANLPELGARASSDSAQSATTTDAPAETSSPRWDAGARTVIDLGGTAPDNQESMNDAHFRRSEQYQLLSERLSAALGQRAAAELGKGNWQFTLHLNPAYLGRIDVRLGRRASGHIDAEFSAAQRDTKDLLQNGMGRLREVMAASGLDMQLLDVRHGDSASASGGHPQPSRQGSAVPFTAAPRIDSGSPAAARTHIDYIGRDGLDVMA